MQGAAMLTVTVKLVMPNLSGKRIELVYIQYMLFFRSCFISNFFYFKGEENGKFHEGPDRRE